MPEPADVAVVIPAFNRASMIERALQSITAQTISPREVIVVDDHSTDDTVRVARRWGATVLQTPENQGSGPARNLGVRQASSQWIAFLDSDDRWRPRHLETVLRPAAGYDLVASGAEASTGQPMGNPLRRPINLKVSALLETSELVVTSGCLVRRQSLIDAGLFRSFRRAQDLDMWVRVLKNGNGVALAERTVEYEVHDAQASLDEDLMLACFNEIVDSCRDEPWFHSRRSSDRIYARIHWDELRTAQATGTSAAVSTEARWFITHPASWMPLARLLRLRRARRRLRTSSADRHRAVPPG